ncbi:ABC transporter permease subunit [Mollicutes bacterium LVI A0078]|nr:ABC transporter permease subunit [Mollicutes bacterium LVI A0075]WOO90402.1 ABC transporter permease subunit [Mollicutes bacterium LVI A0078]
MKDIKKNSGLLLLAVPGIIITILMKYLAYPGLLLAFKDYQASIDQGFFAALWSSPWIGFDNFRFLIMNPDIGLILRNTLGYNISLIIIGTITAVTAAIAINEILHLRTKKTIQTLMFFPFFMSWVSVSYMMVGFFDSDYGLLNQALSFFNLQPIEWYNDPTWWPLIIIIMGTWKGLGYNSVIYLSTIQGFDKSYYEAASIDGASKWQQIKYITVPLLKPMVIILTILGIGGIMYSDFGLFYQLPKNSAALYNVTQTLDIFVYNALKIPNSLGLSAAASFFQSIVGFSLVIGTNFIVRRIDRDSALF